MLKKLTNVILALFLTLSSISYVKTVQAEGGYQLSDRVAFNNLFDNMDDLFGVGNSGHSVGYMSVTLPNGKATSAFCIDPGHAAVPGAIYNATFWDNSISSFKNEGARASLLDYYYNRRGSSLWGTDLGYYATQMAIWSKIRGVNPSNLHIDETISTEQQTAAAEVKALAVEIFNGGASTSHSTRFLYNGGNASSTVDLSDFEFLYFKNGLPYYRSEAMSIVTVGNAGDLSFRVSTDNGFITNSNNYGWETSMNFGEGTNNGTIFYLWLPVLEDEKTSSGKNTAHVSISGDYSFVDTLVWESASGSQTLMSLAVNEESFSGNVTFSGDSMLLNEVVKYEYPFYGRINITSKGYKMNLTEEETSTEYGNKAKMELVETILPETMFVPTVEVNETETQPIYYPLFANEKSAPFVLRKLEDNNSASVEFLEWIIPAGHSKMVALDTETISGLTNVFGLRANGDYQYQTIKAGFNKITGNTEQIGSIPPACDQDSLAECAPIDSCIRSGNAMEDCLVDVECAIGSFTEPQIESGEYDEQILSTCRKDYNLCKQSCEMGDTPVIAVDRAITVYHDVKKFNLTVERSDSESNLLQGKVIGLFYPVDGNLVLLDYKTTDENGQVTFSSEELNLMTTSTYVIKPLNETIGYTDFADDYFEVKEDTANPNNAMYVFNPLNQTAESQNYLLQIVTEKEVEAEKLFATRIVLKNKKNEEVMQGVKFTLEKINSVDAIKKEATTDEMGIADFGSLPEGTYKLTEEVPNGFVAEPLEGNPDGNPITLEINETSATTGDGAVFYSYTVYNYPKVKTDLTIKKNVIKYGETNLVNPEKVENFDHIFAFEIINKESGTKLDNAYVRAFNSSDDLIEDVTQWTTANPYSLPLEEGTNEFIIREVLEENVPGFTKDEKENITYNDLWDRTEYLVSYTVATGEVTDAKIKFWDSATQTAGIEVSNVTFTNKYHEIEEVEPILLSFNINKQVEADYGDAVEEEVLKSFAFRVNNGETNLPIKGTGDDYFEVMTSYTESPEVELAEEGTYVLTIYEAEPFNVVNPATSTSVRMNNHSNITNSLNKFEYTVVVEENAGLLQVTDIKVREFDGEKWGEQKDLAWSKNDAGYIITDVISFVNIWDNQYSSDAINFDIKETFEQANKSEVITSFDASFKKLKKNNFGEYTEKENADYTLDRGNDFEVSFTKDAYNETAKWVIEQKPLTPVQVEAGWVREDDYVAKYEIETVVVPVSSGMYSYLDVIQGKVCTTTYGGQETCSTSIVDFDNFDEMSNTFSLEFKDKLTVKDDTYVIKQVNIEKKTNVPLNENESVVIKLLDGEDVVNSLTLTKDNGDGIAVNGQYTYSNLFDITVPNIGIYNYRIVEEMVSNDESGVWTSEEDEYQVHLDIEAPTGNPVPKYDGFEIRKDGEKVEADTETGVYTLTFVNTYKSNNPSISGFNLKLKETRKELNGEDYTEEEPLMYIALNTEGLEVPYTKVLTSNGEVNYIIPIQFAEDEFEKTFTISEVIDESLEDEWIQDKVEYSFLYKKVFDPATRKYVVDVNNSTVTENRGGAITTKPLSYYNEQALKFNNVHFFPGIIPEDVIVEKTVIGTTLPDSFEFEVYKDSVVNENLLASIDLTTVKQTDGTISGRASLNGQDIRISLDSAGTSTYYVVEKAKTGYSEVSGKTIHKLEYIVELDKETHLNKVVKYLVDGVKVDEPKVSFENEKEVTPITIDLYANSKFVYEYEEGETPEVIDNELVKDFAVNLKIDSEQPIELKGNLENKKLDKGLSFTVADVSEEPIEIEAKVTNEDTANISYAEGSSLTVYVKEDVEGLYLEIDGEEYRDGDGINIFLEHIYSFLDVPVKLDILKVVDGDVPEEAKNFSFNVYDGTSNITAQARNVITSGSASFENDYSEGEYTFTITEKSRPETGYSNYTVWNKDNKTYKVNVKVERQGLSLVPKIVSIKDEKDEDATSIKFVNTYTKPTEETGYTVSYKMNGHGEQIADVTNTKKLPDKFPTPSEKGYVFKGWFLDEEFKEEAKVGTAITKDTKLYAKWETEKGEEEKPTSDKEACEAKGSGYTWNSTTKTCEKVYAPTNTGIGRRKAK